jgi:hypothetical protein
MATLVSTIAYFRDNTYESSSTLDNWELPLVWITLIRTDKNTDALNRYLKQEITAPSSEGGRYTSVTWHPENPLQILLTTKS